MDKHSYRAVFLTLLLLMVAVAACADDEPGSDDAGPIDESPNELDDASQESEPGDGDGDGDGNGDGDGDDRVDEDDARDSAIDEAPCNGGDPCDGGAIDPDAATLPDLPARERLRSGRRRRPAHELKSQRETARNGDGTFAVRDGGAGNAFAIAIADFNRDGYKELRSLGSNRSAARLPKR